MNENDSETSLLQNFEIGLSTLDIDPKYRSETPLSNFSVNGPPLVTIRNEKKASFHLFSSTDFSPSLDESNFFQIYWEQFCCLHPTFFFSSVFIGFSFSILYTITSPRKWSIYYFIGQVSSFRGCSPIKSSSKKLKLWVIVLWVTFLIGFEKYVVADTRDITRCKLYSIISKSFISFDTMPSCFAFPRFLFSSATVIDQVPDIGALKLTARPRLQSRVLCSRRSRQVL